MGGWVQSASESRVRVTYEVNETVSFTKHTSFNKIMNINRNYYVLRRLE